MSLRRYLSGFRPSVDESVLTEPALWLNDRLFWPAFLLSFGGSDIAAIAFDIDPAEVEEYAAELHDPNRWPFLILPLARGHRLYILFRNFEDDSGWDYLLQPADSDTVITLAALEGSFQGPGLSWPELLVTAGQPDPARTQAERLLLLLPAVGDADLPHDAKELVATAVVAVGGEQRYRRQVAGELLTASRRFWGAPAWTEQGDRHVCLGSHSPRSPQTPPDRLALITEALGPGN
ncbi:hypothetical protein [Micromonospora sp. C95]|uniref:hypothetical protein n=1 Tax=Micromonospora sp. C95 TaxID=2824882 RepID=UPI001B3758F4|nr:hypothetical protein [Micromonospora sp. C95]MBQ1028383.1 hypothetical protein [Micromonospora sp. C95]